MARILIIFSGSIGHYKGIAQFISNTKIFHDIIYASNDQKAGRTISKFYGLPCQPAYMNNEFLMNIPLLEKLRLKIDDALFFRRKHILKKLLAQTNPDVVLLDNFNFTDALIIRDLSGHPSLRVLFYQTRLSTALTPSSIYGSVFKKKFQMLNGSKIMKLQKRKRNLEKVLMPGFSDELRIRRLINGFKFENVALNTNRYGPPSLSYLPELILSSNQLANFWTPNQYYMGMGISFVDQKMQSSHRTTVLVSIGSREFIFDFTNKYVETIDFLTNYLRTFTFLIPQSFEARVFGNNIKYYTWDSYNTYLKQADLHITHGGINSIKDSLKHGIPMLICPMDWKSDQIHNALLFKKLGIAKVWNIVIDSKEEVLLKLKLVSKSCTRDALMDFISKETKENLLEQIQFQFSELIEDDRWLIKNW